MIQLRHANKLRIVSFSAVIFLLVGFFNCALASTATVRISDDYGGRIGDYMRRFRELRDSGKNVVVDGDCISACTLVLGYIPPDRICATSHARFGFHRAWKSGLFGFHVFNAAGTAILFSRYPTEVKQWIVERGGLSDETIYLSGDQLAAMIRPCKFESSLKANAP